MSQEAQQGKKQSKDEQKDRQPLQNPRKMRVDPDLIQSVHVAACDQFVALVFGAQLHVFDLSSSFYATSTLKQVGRTVIIIPSTKVIAVGGDMKTIEFFTVSNGSLTAIGVTEPFAKRLCVMAPISATSKNFAAADKFGDVFALSPERTLEKDRAYALQHLSILTALSFSPCNKFVVSCDCDCHVRVSSAAMPAIVEAFLWSPAPQSVVTSVTWTKRSGYLVTGCDNGRICVWNLNASPVMNSQTALVGTIAPRDSFSVVGIVPIAGCDGFIVIANGSDKMLRFESVSDVQPTTIALPGNPLVTCEGPSKEAAAFVMLQNSMLVQVADDGSMKVLEAISKAVADQLGGTAWPNECDNAATWRAALGGGYGVASRSIGKDGVMKEVSEEDEEQGEDEPQRKSSRKESSK